jgi:hypothetical protein
LRHFIIIQLPFQEVRDWRNFMVSKTVLLSNDNWHHLICTQGICKVVMLEISVRRLHHVWLMSHRQLVCIVCSATVYISEGLFSSRTRASKKNPCFFWNRNGTSLCHFLVLYYSLYWTQNWWIHFVQKFDQTWIKLELLFKDSNKPQLGKCHSFYNVGKMEMILSIYRCIIYWNSPNKS